MTRSRQILSLEGGHGLSAESVDGPTTEYDMDWALVGAGTEDANGYAGGGWAPVTIIK